MRERESNPEDYLQLTSLIKGGVLGRTSNKAFLRRSPSQRVLAGPVVKPFFLLFKQGGSQSTGLDGGCRKVPYEPLNTLHAPFSRTRSSN